MPGQNGRLLVKAAASAFALLITATPALGQSAPAMSGYSVTYDEEFNEQQLDPTRWVARGTGAVAIGADLEAFLPSNVQMLQPSQGENGVAFNVQAPIGGYNATTTKNFAYTSGYINGFGIHQKYGYWTAHLALPNTGSGNGTWPAWWMMPVDGSWNFEIDIMEQFNITDWGAPDPSHVYSHLHWGNGAHSATICSSGADPNNWTGYHDYAVDWQPNGGTKFPSVTVPYLAIYIDGVLCTGPDNPTGIYTGAGIPNIAMYPLLEDNVGNVPEHPDLTKPFIAKSVWLYERNDVTSPVEPLRMGVVTSDKTVYKPGDTATFTATVYAGNSTVTNVGGSMGVFDICGDNGTQGFNECSPSSGNSIFGNWTSIYPPITIPAHSSAQVSWQYVLPLTIPTGYIYNYYGGVGGNVGSTNVSGMNEYIPFSVQAAAQNASCGSTPSGSTTTTLLSTTTGSMPASVQQCPYGGTQATTTTVSQVYLCTNGTLSAQGSPVTTTLPSGSPVCTAPVACGTTPSGSTKTTTLSTTMGTISATLQQCPYGGTQPTTTTVTQVYLCTNGSLAAQGAPVTSTVNTGTPTCNTAASCGSTPSGSTQTQTVSTTTGSTSASGQLCPYGGTQPTTTTVTQVYLCTNGTLAKQGSSVSTTVANGTPTCNVPVSCGTTPSGGSENTIINQTSTSVAATAAQCAFGGTITTTVATVQAYLCTNGTLSSQGSPVTTTTVGNPFCNAAKSSTVLGPAVGFFKTNETDVIKQDGYGNISCAGSNSAGQAAGAQFLLHQQAAVPFVPNSKILGSSTNFVGQGESDLITRDPAGTITDWGFDASGQWLGSQFLSYNGGPVPFETDAMVIGSGINFFGESERDIVTRDTAGTLINWGFDSTGEWIGSQFLLHGTQPAPFETNASIIGTANNFFGDDEQDIVTRDAAGTVINWGFDNTGQWIGSEFLVQNSSTLLPSAPSISILGSVHNLQTEGTNDLIVRSPSGAFSFDEFDGFGVMTATGTLSLAGTQHLSTLNHSTMQNFNGRTSVIDITDLPFDASIAATVVHTSGSAATLTVIDNGATVASITLHSLQFAQQLLALPDGASGTLLVEATP